MQLSRPFITSILALALSWITFVLAQNQTPDVSPIFPGDRLPFRVRIELVKKGKQNFLLPNGIQSFVFGVQGDKFLLLTGRTNGLHGFNNDPNNFPPQAQNQIIYVIDMKRKKIASRSLVSPGSGLTQDQIDSLSVTAAQFYQRGDTLYITGGYGFRNSDQQFITFDTLTAINVPGLIHWVTHPDSHSSASDHIRQISDPIFRVTGGEMHQLTANDPTLLVFGQDFEGTYATGTATQVYTLQVRRFNIHDDGTNLSIKILPASNPDASFRRRDLNIVSTLRPSSQGRGLNYGLVVLSGVFTPGNNPGAWTVPVTITADGMPSMLDPTYPATFKQGMNNYSSPYISLYSRKANAVYMILLGGITYEYFQDGVLQQDAELPFTNQVTTVKWDKHGNFKQYIMDAEYPVILSTRSNPGNRLLFGASASFIHAPGLEKLQFQQGIFKFDRIHKPLVLGYIVGGIQSTLMNTNTMSDSAASPYIFKVILEPIDRESCLCSKKIKNS